MEGGGGGGGVSINVIIKKIGILNVIFAYLKWFYFRIELFIHVSPVLSLSITCAGGKWTTVCN